MPSIELTKSAIDPNIHIVCLPEHRYYHRGETGNGWTFVSSSAWKHSVNAVISGVGMLIGPWALKSLNNFEKISSRIMIATFNGNSSTTIISCYSPSNACDETGFDAFHNKLSCLVRSILKHNALIISGDMNAQIGKNVNNKFSLHDSTNRNKEHQVYFILENWLTGRNTKFQKRKRKLWSYTFPNKNKAQIDYLLINKEWINSTFNSEAYSSFKDVSSDQWIVTAKIRLSLRKNAARTSTTAQYDCSLLNNKDISD